MFKVSKAAQYAIIFITTLLSGVLIFVLWGMKVGSDHFASIPLKNDTNWYESHNDLFNRQIQDRDILYHHVGKSISEAKKADIIILGHSMLLFGLNNDLIVEFEKKHHIRIFNMATAGDGSGEFIRKLIRRNRLQPKLWIINADDHGASFFSAQFDDLGGFGRSSAGRVISYHHFTGEMNVISRNISWRIQDTLLNMNLTPYVGSYFLRTTPNRLWRNIQTGNWHLEVPVYFSEGDPIKVIRNQDCHATFAEVEYAQFYIENIQSRSMLMLMPHSEYCPTRLKELANNLGLEHMIFDPKKSYRSYDQSHLTNKGAIAFTRDFLQRLEKSNEFKLLLKNIHTNHVEPNVMVTKLKHSFNLCFSNPSKKNLYVRMFDQNNSHDFLINGNEKIQVSGTKYGVICWDKSPFTTPCPHLKAQWILAC